jgi:P27 family predicted phage terminase small subunit
LTKGRKPKPPELRVFKGNRGHRIIPNTSKHTPQLPYAPRWLSSIAKQEWRRISKELYTLVLLTTIDRAALEAYCQCYARWREAEEKVTIETFETDTGYVGQNPYINIAIKYVKEMRAFLVEFGMIPSSRVDIEKLKDTKSEWDDLIGAR